MSGQPRSRMAGSQSDGEPADDHGEGGRSARPDVAGPPFRGRAGRVGGPGAAAVQARKDRLEIRRCCNAKSNAAGDRGDLQRAA